MVHVHARHALPDVVFLVFGICILLFFVFVLFELIKVFNKKQKEDFSPPLKTTSQASTVVYD